MAEDSCTPPPEIDATKPFKIQYDAESSSSEGATLKAVSPNDRERRQNDTFSSIKVPEMRQINKQKSVTNSAQYLPLFFTAVNCDDDAVDDYKKANHEHTHTTTNSLQPHSDILKPLDIDIQLQIQNKIKFDLLQSMHCWTRVCILFLIVLLILLSICYAFGGTMSVELDLIQSCVGKSLDDIWEHSDLINNTEGTHEGCWSTSNMTFNLNQAYYQNRYTCLDRTDSWSTPQFIVFICFTIYCSCSLIYSVYTLIVDMIAIQEQKLYMKSPKFKHYLSNQQTTSTNKPLSDHRVSCFVTDSRAYISMMISAEIWEIIIQSTALLLYNGYNIMRREADDKVYLANRPNVIILFACFLSFNCMMTGILWLLYVFKHSKCKGLLFKLCSFCVDQLCDLLYIIYPFIVILSTPATKFNHGDEGSLCIVFGLLNINSFAGLVVTMFPVFFLCTKCVFMSRSAMREMRNQSYEMWFAVTKIMSTSNQKDADYVAKILGFQLTKKVNKEIYDANGNLHLTVMNTSAPNNKPAAIQNKCCRISVLVLGVMLILYSISILSLVINHIAQSDVFCESVVFDSDLIALHPEFHVYHLCDYKVFPFTFTNDSCDRCECRELIVDIESREDAIFNISHVLSAVLSEWQMLEKLIVEYELDTFTSNTTLELASVHFGATEMKIFDMNGIDVLSIDPDIANWQQLSHFGLQNAVSLQSLPSSFSTLTELQSITIIGSSKLQDSMHLFCNLKHLIIIEIMFHNSEIIPSCFVGMQQLKGLFVENGALISFPLEMLNMKSLQEFSLWQNNISPISLIAADNNTNVEIFNESLYNEMKVWIQANPICNHISLHNLEYKGIDAFIRKKDACLSQCSSESNACAPTKLGNGICNPECNIAQCYNDMGDCVQFCFTKTNCTYEAFLNEECDSECNNAHCKWDNDYCDLIPHS